MNKDIKDLTEAEAEQILKFVYPNKKDNSFSGLHFKRIKNEDGSEDMTFSFRPIIGIEYHNGQDRCILHFDNTKVVLWLYKNGYDITELLEHNSYLSEMEKDFENFAFEIKWLGMGEDGFRDGFKQNWNLDYVTKKCEELNNKYYFKDYEH